MGDVAAARPDGDRGGSVTTRAAPLTVAQVAGSLGRHLGVYRRKAPRYQTAMLNSLLSLWHGRHDRLLDIGGGTGVIGQCVQDFFPVGEVHAIDVADRFCPTLTIPTRVYDGRSMPFADAGFDAALLNNVVHHVPVAERLGLFLEVRRVVRGPVYIKDHEGRGWLDRPRLAALDLVGNMPFGGMVRASYLAPGDWAALAAASGFRIAESAAGTYRTGAFAAAFPNRLETTMRWEPV
jgi:SAM-dependent methyltransferase